MEINPRDNRAGKGHLVLNIQPQENGGRGSENKVLITKWLTENNISPGKARNATQAKWRTHGEITIKREAKNLFVCTFPTVAGRDAVWNSRPWSLSNCLIAIQKWDEETKPEEVEFPTVTLWAQIHDLPQVLKEENSIQNVAEFLFPKLHRVDRSSLEATGWMRFTRVLIEVDLQEPVLIGFEYPLGRKAVWVSLKYERFTDLCYFCGKIGHLFHSCQTREECREKGYNTEPSGIYRAALKAGYESPAATPPASFRRKTQGQIDREERHLEKGNPSSQDGLGNTTPTALITGAGESSTPISQTMGDNLFLGQRSITDTDIFPHSSPSLQQKLCSPRRLEDDLEEVAAAVQYSLDLNVGAKYRGDIPLQLKKGTGLICLGSEKEMGLVVQTHNFGSPHYIMEEQQPLSIVEEAQLNYERELGRAEKKRKQEWLLNLSGGPSGEFVHTNLSKPFLFSPGSEGNTAGDKRKKIGARRE
ncbi:unnamed protein product [Linum trigynum]|uniref:CCHC-type domain-containing protein n=1 Tax=Linum trigynum TaxID=586398 RepID=A0AAV2G7G4_9ROSI